MSKKKVGPLVCEVTVICYRYRIIARVDEFA